MSAAFAQLTVTVHEELLPAFDPSHGTPSPMRRRRFTFRLAQAAADFEQTDYGHPGRWNPPEPRGIDVALQSRTDVLQAAAVALGTVLN